MRFLSFGSRSGPRRELQPDHEALVVAYRFAVRRDQFFAQLADRLSVAS